MVERLQMKTKDLSQEKIRIIGELFPNCITESKEGDKTVISVDFDALKQELSGNIVEGTQERYQFTWPDKSKAKRLANTPTTMALRPCREESVDFDNTKNLYIEGDNLEVLKILRETYLGKVKMIYIDPPYNTGNDFVYNDDFSMSAEDYSAVSGENDDSGNRLFLNTSSNGRFHTDWLNMIYPRLLLAKDLLSDDGVIFISLDDNEIENLKKICIEIFGEQNFVSQIVLVNNIAGRSDCKDIATSHEYILVFQKSNNFVSNGLSLSEKQLQEYKYSDKDGQYRLQGLRKRGSGSLKTDRPNMWYPVYYSVDRGMVSLNKSDFNDYVEILPKLSDGSDGRWRWGKDTFEKKKHLIEVKMVSGRGEYDVYEKVYLNGENGIKTTKMKSFLLDPKYTSDAATTEYKSVMEQKTFDNPKSVCLIKDLLTVANTCNEIVMDFFSGSSTTAHALMQLNMEDGGNRHFIMVQVPNKTNEKTEAYKAGYENICEIGKERIRRVGCKIKEKDFSSLVDVGFRVFKCDSSNMNDVFYSSDNVIRESLDDYVDVIKNDRGPEDLLIQVMLELGIELSSRIERKDVHGYTVFSVDDGYLIACFDDSIDIIAVTEMSKEMSGCMHAVFRSGSSMSDEMLANIEQIFKTYSPQTKINIL